MPPIVLLLAITGLIWYMYSNETEKFEKEEKEKKEKGDGVSKNDARSRRRVLRSRPSANGTSIDGSSIVRKPVRKIVTYEYAELENEKVEKVTEAELDKTSVKEKEA